MKLAGTHVLPATPQQVWEFLVDPERLVHCLPGCEKLEPDGPDKYKVAIKYKLAAFSGNYSGSVQLSEKKEPKSLRMLVEGKGAPGFMKGAGLLELSAKGKGTEVRYDGDVQVGGVIASIGQRIIEATGKKIVQQFFECAAKQLGPK